MARVAMLTVATPPGRVNIGTAAATKQLLTTAKEANALLASSAGAAANDGVLSSTTFLSSVVAGPSTLTVNTVDNWSRRRAISPPA